MCPTSARAVDKIVKHRSSPPPTPSITSSSVDVEITKGRFTAPHSALSMCIGMHFFAVPAGGLASGVNTNAAWCSEHARALHKGFYSVVYRLPSFISNIQSHGVPSTLLNAQYKAQVQ